MFAPFRVLAVWLLALGAAQAAPEAVPLYREIKDWVVACDNQRGCQALSARESSDYSSLRLLLERAAGPEGLLSLRLIYAGQPPSFPLLLDGRPLPELLTGSLRKVPDDSALILRAEGKAVHALLAELRNADRLSMLLVDDPEAEVSLAGLSAVLLLMDSVQGRLETRGALYRPGDRSDTEVPPAPGLPVLPAYPGAAPLAPEEAERIRQAVMLAARDPAQEEEMDQAPVGEAFALNEREALVLVRSWCAAYNCEFALYRVLRQPPYEEVDLRLDPLPLNGSEPAGWVHYDLSTGVLEYRVKARGVGDCGESGSWRFDGERFRVQAYRLMSRCASGDPGEWPALWRVAGD
ncbi:DUF1176 domain-containing protein [Pseudomonas sp. PDM16]|uniref:DUF1176 domain-containing protein n=1 Tax=Pseudomonas sp. PDM16 TaxID=2769292 RepID=UPI0017867704|nr:DUF1176 domain-containing protein [Pseudomonas sp. PDM16]MBD9416352.1 DUF1176 domain-containing protein [Pseudomonas sp. PDM16]